MDEPQLTYKISWVGGLLIIALALAADLLQIFLSFTIALSPANIIITIMVEGGVFFYFLIVGVPFIRGKRALGRLFGWLFTTIIELVPILDAIPTLTFGVVLSVHSSRKADKEEYEKAHAEWEANMRQRQAGIRQWNNARQNRLRNIAATAAVVGTTVATGGASAAAEGAVAASRAGQATRAAGRMAGTAERTSIRAAEQNMQNRSVQAVRTMGDIAPRPAANDTELGERREAA